MLKKQSSKYYNNNSSKQQSQHQPYIFDSLNSSLNLITRTNDNDFDSLLSCKSAVRKKDVDDNFANDQGPQQQTKPINTTQNTSLIHNQNRSLHNNGYRTFYQYNNQQPNKKSNKLKSVSAAVTTAIETLPDIRWAIKKPTNSASNLKLKFENILNNNNSYCINKGQNHHHLTQLLLSGPIKGLKLNDNSSLNLNEKNEDTLSSNSIETIEYVNYHQLSSFDLLPITLTTSFSDISNNKKLMSTNVPINANSIKRMREIFNLDNLPIK
jgi:CRISPR/Cas system CSM-associated protein Csm2 small subunit